MAALEFERRSIVIGLTVAPGTSTDWWATQFAGSGAQILSGLLALLIAALLFNPIANSLARRREESQRQVDLEREELRRTAELDRQDRQHQADIAREERDNERRIKTELVERLSAVVYSLHYRLEHFERAERHHAGQPQDRARLRDETARQFVTDRASLGALQNVIDRYYAGGEPGALVHRVTDLIMAKHAWAMAVPRSQREELLNAIVGPDHTALTRAELDDYETVQTKFAASVKAAFVSMVDTPIQWDGYRTSKILTGPDGRRGSVDSDQ